MTLPDTLVVKHQSIDGKLFNAFNLLIQYCITPQSRINIWNLSAKDGMTLCMCFQSACKSNLNSLTGWLLDVCIITRNHSQYCLHHILIDMFGLYLSTFFVKSYLFFALYINKQYWPKKKLFLTEHTSASAMPLAEKGYFTSTISGVIRGWSMLSKWIFVWLLKFLYKAIRNDLQCPRPMQPILKIICWIYN